MLDTLLSHILRRFRTLGETRAGVAACATVALARRCVTLACEISDTWLATPLQVPEPVDEGEEEEEGEDDDLPPQPPLCRWVTQDAFENLSDWQWPTVLCDRSKCNKRLGIRHGETRLCFSRGSTLIISVQRWSSIREEATSIRATDLQYCVDPVTLCCA